MKWPLTFYVNSLPKSSAGCTNGPVIRILKRYQSDQGLYQHELTHVKQWFATLTLHSWLYALLPKYRLWAEVQAYKKQLNYSLDKQKDASLFASFIHDYYDLENVDQANVTKQLLI